MRSRPHAVSARQPIRHGVRRASGPAAPLLLVHGTLGDYRTWALQMEPFGARYRTIAVSLRHCWPERWDGDGDDFTVQQHTQGRRGLHRRARCGSRPSRRSLPRRAHRLPGRAKLPDLVRKLVLAEPGGALDASLEPQHAPKSLPIALGPLYAAAAAHISRGEIDEGLAPDDRRRSTAPAAGRNCRTIRSSRCGTTPARCWANQGAARSVLARRRGSDHGAAPDRSRENGRRRLTIASWTGSRAR